MPIKPSAEVQPAHASPEGKRKNQSRPGRERTDRMGTRVRVPAAALFIMLFLGLSLLFSVASGAVAIPVKDVAGYLFTGKTGALREVLWNIRLPRTIVAALVGANLAVAGVLLQGVMRNPLADPHIIGVSSGAGLSGIILLILFPHMQGMLTPVAFLGATAAALFIYLLAWKNGISPMRVILAGVAVSAFLGSGISALLTFYSDRVHGALVFLVGGWPPKAGLMSVLFYRIR
ncbi:putative siderophore transport system permease protein YfhA [Paenibacillus konkukensis]|uniref:Siderophore transport system permease protein YfhA n=1 Tax=Paenibacillus konkukensis TaxID=2020716 RepID=A0ABY4RHN6_9BACL|nr:putative siderophore transport system permease protein YfhA [Paenibacillus konkukensis]